MKWPTIALGKGIYRDLEESNGSTPHSLPLTFTPVIAALFFDAAGTLIDTAEPVAETYARILSSHGHRVQVETLAARFPEAFSTAGEPDFAGLPDGDTAERAWWRSIVDTCAGEAVADAAFEGLFSHYAQASAWTVLPEVLETLEAAKNLGLRLAVVSNFDARLHNVLAELGLNEHFELIVTSADARSRKPSPVIFRHALAELSLQPEQVRHIGDSSTCDGAGALAAGIRPYLLAPPERTVGRFLEEVRTDLPK